MGRRKIDEPKTPWAPSPVSSEDEAAFSAASAMGWGKPKSWNHVNYSHSVHLYIYICISTYVRIYV